VIISILQVVYGCVIRDRWITRSGWWIPRATAVAFVAWTARLRTRASADLIVLARLERELRDERLARA
jgi:hypothetical protein